MNVLYIDDTGAVNGAQEALLDLLRALPPTVIPTLMCPKGALAQSARDLGVRVVRLSGTSGGDVARSALSVRRMAGIIGAHVVHGNSLRTGFIAGCSRRLGGPPTVVHLHNTPSATRSADLMRCAVRVGADAVITSSDHVTTRFVPDGGRDRIHMLYDPVAASSLGSAAMTKHQARAALGLERDVQLAGVVAAITPWKGQDTAIKALHLLRERHPSARLLIVGDATTRAGGSARYDDLSFERWLYRLVRGLELEAHVEFWGRRQDTAIITRALDVLLAPSWEEPFGRSVAKGMALQTAVIATSVGGPPEYIDHGIDGLLLPPRDIQRWAVALERLLRDAALRERIARQGRITAQSRFDAGAYASKVLQVYDQVVGRPARLGDGAQGVGSRGDLRQAVGP